jgi:arylformamidase
MLIHDLSVGVSPSLPVWPGNPGIEIVRVQNMDNGDHANVSRLSLGVHTGTHVDAPVHFVKGAAGVDSLRLDVLVGPALVIHLPDVTSVTAADLEAAQIPAGTQRLLIKTHNSTYWANGDTQFHTEFAGVALDAAQWLVAHHLALVGVDYLSVAPWKQSTPTHRALLEAGVVIVEGLNLTGIEPGTYDFTCLPLKLVGSDGAPARAIITVP